MKKTDSFFKYGVIVHGSSKVVNIGDYIQAVASAQFLPHVDIFLEREKIGEYDGEEVKAIMNAWYMYDGNQWPPSKKIHPLYISIHINKTAKHIFSTPESIDYLKNYTPIGCRDKSTKQYLDNLGINAYFSGCMTLTLGFKYKRNVHNSNVYFVDPAMPGIGNVFNQMRLFWKSIFHYKKVSPIFRKKYPQAKTIFKEHRRWLATAAFYIEYRKYFDENMLLNAEYINQGNIFYKQNFQTHKERFIEAERLIKQYATARLVVTSRIHCALPCTGLETPVIYTYQCSQDENSSCRLDGLLQLFNVMNIDSYGHIHPLSDFDSSNKISVNNLPIIKYEWKELANDMIARCKEFINS